MLTPKKISTKKLLTYCAIILFMLSAAGYMFYQTYALISGADGGQVAVLDPSKALSGVKAGSSILPSSAIPDTGVKPRITDLEAQNQDGGFLESSQWKNLVPGPSPVKPLEIKKGNPYPFGKPQVELLSETAQ